MKHENLEVVIFVFCENKSSFVVGDNFDFRWEQIFAIFPLNGGS